MSSADDVSRACQPDQDQTQDQYPFIADNKLLSSHVGSISYPSDYWREPQHQPLRFGDCKHRAIEEGNKEQEWSVVCWSTLYVAATASTGLTIADIDDSLKKRILKRLTLMIDSTFASQAIVVKVMTRRKRKTPAFKRAIARIRGPRTWPVTLTTEPPSDL